MNDAARRHASQLSSREMNDAADNLRRLIEYYRTMARIRAFEETALVAHKAGEIPGPLHVSIGQEAVATGVCANLSRADRLTSNHRGHGHAIAKGAEFERSTPGNEITAVKRGRSGANS